jgi:hypothetical protein
MKPAQAPDFTYSCQASAEQFFAVSASGVFRQHICHLVGAAHIPLPLPPKATLAVEVLLDGEVETLTRKARECYSAIGKKEALCGQSSFSQLDSAPPAQKQQANSRASSADCRWKAARPCWGLKAGTLDDL